MDSYPLDMNFQTLSEISGQKHFLSKRPIQAVSLEKKQFAEFLSLCLQNTDHNSSNELTWRKAKTILFNRVGLQLVIFNVAKQMSFFKDASYCILLPDDRPTPMQHSMLSSLVEERVGCTHTSVSQTELDRVWCHQGNLTAADWHTVRLVLAY